MDLGNYLSPGCIATGMEAKDKWEVLSKVVNLLDAGGVFKNQPVNKASVLDDLRKREEAQSTGLGEGIAIPHARISGFKGMAIALVTLKNPTPFDSLDGKPVNLVWVILVAEDMPTLALQAYSKIQELMLDEAIRLYFASVNDPEPIYDYICQRRIPVGGILTARDIMRTPQTHILPDMPLREVVRLMRKQHIEAVAVEDADRHIVGEITCDRLFQYGIPDFFNQLQSVAFINRFDPFEKYFDAESKATAQDVMQKDFAVVTPEATMLEVVFSLTVQRHPKVYVVEEGRRVGTIDRIEVLNRILDF